MFEIRNKNMKLSDNINSFDNNALNLCFQELSWAACFTGESNFLELSGGQAL